MLSWICVCVCVRWMQHINTRKHFFVFQEGWYMISELIKAICTRFSFKIKWKNNNNRLLLTNCVVSLSLSRFSLKYINESMMLFPFWALRFGLILPFFRIAGDADTDDDSAVSFSVALIVGGGDNSTLLSLRL